jgi:hypothetical protein
MGLVTGVLYKSSEGYELDGRPGDTIFLGEDLDEIIRNLRKDQARLMRLYDPFVMYLADGYDELVSRLKQPVEPHSREPAVLLPGLGTDAPFARLQEVAAALIPYLRRRPAGRHTVARGIELCDRRSGGSG